MTWLPGEYGARGSASRDKLASKVQFGVFEVDLHSGELRKAGIRIKLQEQPFKVLAALLERPGEVVSREELRQRIWLDTTFGDGDHAVNVAVTKLRNALGDSAEAPRVIETLHRRGYRLIVAAPRLEFDSSPERETKSGSPTQQLQWLATRMKRHRAWRAVQHQGRALFAGLLS